MWSRLSNLSRAASRKIVRVNCFVFREGCDCEQACDEEDAEFDEWKSTSDQTGVFDATDDVSVLAITFSKSKSKEE